MNIFGLGTDIVDIERLKRSIKKNTLLKKRIFSKREILFCEKKKINFSCYSKRFAAKEAFAKALGTGIAKGIKFNEIELLNNSNGKPYIVLKGKTLRVTKKIIKKNLFKFFVTLSDEKKYSIATVIITI
jgi:holo-[acyl-carrier protein] synthase